MICHAHSPLQFFLGGSLTAMLHFYITGIAAHSQVDLPISSFPGFARNRRTRRLSICQAYIQNNRSLQGRFVLDRVCSEGRWINLKRSCWGGGFKRWRSRSIARTPPVSRSGVINLRLWRTPKRVSIVLNAGKLFG